MTKNKLAIIGGSGLYDIEGMQNPKWKSISTPWGKPSDQILNLKYKGKEICFLPRHARGHKISIRWNICCYGGPSIFYFSRIEFI